VPLPAVKRRTESRAAAARPTEPRSAGSSRSGDSCGEAPVSSQARAALLAWYDSIRRDLPWRRTRDPYRIWISEVMLQQTQVVTVIPFWERFVARFPDPASLARADETEVLRLWEGLGYYRRARSLHAAAKLIVERHQGRFPETFDEVSALPGIGRYTAGAILSIGLDQPLPILEGNTIRVHSRMRAVRDDVGSTATQRRLWEIATGWIDDSTVAVERPGDLNQALMELGATVCRVRAPECGSCPVARWCEGTRTGIAASLPIDLRKTDVVDRSEGIVVVRRGERVLLRRCGRDERWAGLWDFPRYELSRPLELPRRGAAARRGPFRPEPLLFDSPDEHAAALTEALQRDTGLATELVDTGWRHRHAVTRYRIRLGCWQAVRVAGRLKGRDDDAGRGVVWEWVESSDLDDRPLSVTGRLIAERLKTEGP